MSSATRSVGRARLGGLRGQTRARHLGIPQRGWLPLLVASCALIAVLAVVFGAEVIPPSLVLVPVLVGGLTVRMPAMRLLLAAAAVAVGVDLALLGVRAVRPLTLLNVVVTAGFALQLTRIRGRLGVSAPRSESILLELRDRLRRHGDLPALPAGWSAELAVRSAGGGSFGGDFLVASRSADGRVLELVLVDVSGKGVGVGSRALLLSGALGGLLGAVAPERFLHAANDYLFRQGWEDGFATAAYLALDVDSGRYALRSAGHPPAARLHAGSGKWALGRARGPLLGVLAEAEFVAEEGHLGQHDALLLYTDGVVEAPGRELAAGIDRLLGEAERLVPRGFAGGAERLLTAVADRGDDDRALLLLWHD